MNSLDPRVKRLSAEVPTSPARAALDQFGTYEVFVQPKEGKPFQHEGVVHAPNLEMAYVLAKEAFTRRFLCVSLYVADTRCVHVSAMTEGGSNAYEGIGDTPPSSGGLVDFEIYHLTKRGKQHVHAGTVLATNAQGAMAQAKLLLQSGKNICNVWAIRSNDIRYTLPSENDFWSTLPDKKFRDAAEYKGGDKLKLFLDTRREPSS
jgi:ring-1,2-phenylacetyl-CoA epoxidase subunit PaaB